MNTGSLKKRFIFQKLKKLGLKIVVVHREKNWAQAYADEWILADPTNYHDCLDRIKHFLSDNPKIKIDGVLTFWEDSVLITAKIAEMLKLPGIPFDIAKKTKNKFLFREFCHENNIAAPNHCIVKKDEDINKGLQKLKFPLIIKPVYGASSSFVIKTENEEELKQSYNFIRENILAHPDAAEWDNHDLILEEYIDGDEVDIDIVLQNGKIKFHSITDNNKTREPFFVETGDAIPSGLPEKVTQSLFDLAEETLEKLNLLNGVIHFEAKVSKKRAVPIEVNLRMGGDQTYFYIKKAWNIDLVEMAVKIALGIHLPKISKPENPYKYLVGQYFLSDYSGILAKRDIDPSIEDLDFVEELFFFKDIGDEVRVPPEGYDYLGWIIVSGTSHREASENLKTALELINFDVARFRPMSSIGQTSRKNSLSSSLLKKYLPPRGAKIEKIRRTSIENQRNLHIGIAGNLYGENANPIEQDLMNIGNVIKKTLVDLGYKVTFFDFNNLQKTFRDLKTSNVDLIFNVCERINESSLLEPHVASILDALQIPYTGSSPFTLGLCIDKIRIKKLLSYHNIPTPKWDYMYSMDDDLRDDLKYPLIVKPANTDNSIGITNESVVTNERDLRKQLEKVIIDIGRPALIEEYIEGDEYDVSILGSETDDLRVLPLSRSIFDKLPENYWHIYPFEAKFAKDPAYKTGISVQRPPKQISKKLANLISEIALDTYNILDCHDYGRVEIRVDKNNNPYVLELNPNPSIDITDCVPQVAKLAGMDYGDFIEEIIRMAIKRYQTHPPYFHLQPSVL
ncbi:ATP-grasp domain-containing protein [Patescibacteria group bacterium]|nr:ATP-grasp domain-containing protein [Patescibacteria group bacterium]